MNRASLAFVFALGGIALPSLADPPITYFYFAQGQCVQAGSWASKFVPQGGLVAQLTWNGHITFDMVNKKAFVSQDGTYSATLAPGQILLGTWTTPHDCVYDLHVSNDLSFTLQSTPQGCLTVDGAATGWDISSNFAIRGRLAPDLSSFVAGIAGDHEPVQQTLVHYADDGTVQGSQMRVCAQMFQGTRQVSRR